MAATLTPTGQEAGSNSTNQTATPPAPRRKPMGRFAKVSLIASLAGILLVVVLMLWVTSAVKAPLPTASPTVPVESVQTPAPAQSLPQGDAYVLLVPTKSMSASFLAAAADETKRRLSEAGVGAEVQCVGPNLFVAFKGSGTAVGADTVQTMGDFQMGTLSSTAPDTAGHAVGCQV